MPVSPHRREELERQLNAATPIRSRAMFGGIGIYHEDAFFAVIDDDRLYFKVDNSNLEDYGQAEAWVVQPGTVNMGYREVPENVLSNPDILRTWIAKAVAVTTSKKKTRR